MSGRTKKDQLFDALRAAVADMPKVEVYEHEQSMLHFHIKGRNMRLRVVKYGGAPYIEANVHHPDEVRLLAIVVGVIESAR